MKKFNLSITIRKGFEDTPFAVYEIDTEHFEELFKLSKLSTFKDDAYFTVSLIEIEEEKEEEA